MDTCSLTKQELDYAVQVFRTNVPADAQQLLLPKMTRSGLIYGYYGSVKARRMSGGASWAQHAIAMALVMGALGVSAAAIMYLSGDVLLAAAKQLNPGVVVTGRMLAKCSNSQSAFMTHFFAMVNPALPCEQRQQLMDAMLAAAAGTLGIAGVWSYGKVLSAVESISPACLKGPKTLNYGGKRRTRKLTRRRKQV